MPPLSIILEFSRTEEPSKPFAFQAGLQDYTLRTPGGGRKQFQLNWDQEFLAEIDSLRWEPEPAALAKIGVKLRDSLADWSSIEKSIEKAVSSAQQVVVTIRSNAAELFALPWELMTIGAAGSHLGELTGVVLRYEWPETLTTPADPSPRPESGRVLVAWSAMGGPVPSDEHLKAIERADRDGNIEFDRNNDVLVDASVPTIAAALTRAAAENNPYVILHLLAHGGAIGSTYGVLLDGPQNNYADAVDAGRLRRLLAPHASTLRLVVLASCDGANPGKLGNRLGSLAQTLHRRGVQSVVASRYPLSVVGSTILSETLYHSLSVEFHSLERALTEARAQLSLTDRLDWAGIQLYARASDGDDTRPVIIRPYRGLEYFDYQHRGLFFGRDAEIKTALEKLETLRAKKKPNLLFILGASGSGKSSFARAGLRPKLEPDFAAVRVVRPGEFDTQMLPSERPLLLFVDQAEEAFTQLEKKDATPKLFAQLYDLASDNSGSVVILTMRVEFLSRCGEVTLPDENYLDTLAYDDLHQLPIRKMTRAVMTEIITKPARSTGIKITDELANDLIDDVSGKPGALPLLEFTLDQMWKERSSKGLTLTGYQNLGGAVGVLLGQYADSVIDDRMKDEEERVQARRLLVGLVDPHRPDTRRARAIAEFPVRKRELFDAVLAKLTAARLVVTSGDREPKVELVHEELIRRWGRLRTWAEDDRQKSLEIDHVKSWDHLLRGAQLDRARQARELYGYELGETLAHIQESERVLAEEEDQERRRQFQLRTSLVVSVVAALVAMVLFFRADKAAEDQKAAKELANEALEKELTANENFARKLREEQGARASLLAKTPGRKLEAVQLGVISVGSSPASAPLSALKGLAAASFEAMKVRQLKGHTGTVEAVAFSPDSQLIATASGDNTARLWDANSGAHLHSLKGHTGTVEVVAFSPDGRHIATASMDHTARLWDKSGTHLRSFEGHTDSISAVAFSPDGQRIATASHDRTARLWDANSGAHLHSLEGHTGPVYAVAFSLDGERIATASEDRTTRLWDSSSGSHLQSLEGHTDSVWAVAFSPDGQHIVTAGEDGTARLWDSSSGAHLHSLKGHTGPIIAVVFSPDGQHIVTASFDDNARLWDANSGAYLHSLGGQKSLVMAVAFSPDGQRIATASGDHTTHLWDSSSGAHLHSLEGHTGSVMAVAFSPDGQRIATGSRDRTARLWNVNFGALFSLEGHTGSISGVAFSPDGERIATASYDNNVRLWDAKSGVHLHSLEHKGSVSAVAFSPDGERIVTDSWNAHLWDAKSGAHLHSFEGSAVVFSPKGERIATAGRTGRLWDAKSGARLHLLRQKGSVSAVAFSPDGERIVTANDDGTADLWDVKSGAHLHSFEGRKVAFSPNSERIVTASNDGTAHLWDASSGAHLHSLEGHIDSISAVAFSPDGERIATVSKDRTARLWDSSSGTHLQSLEGHTGPVWSVAFSPNGLLIATASRDAARLWDVSSGAHLHSLEGSAVVFSPDGQRIATVSRDTARLWLASPEAWLRHGCELLSGFDEYNREIAAICDPCLNDEKCFNKETIDNTDR